MQTKDASFLDINVTNPEDNPQVSIKCIKWAPKASSPTFMASDRGSHIRIYNLHPEENKLIQKACIDTESPCLSVSWGADEAKAVGGGLDNSVKLFDLATGKFDMIGSHKDSVRSVYWLGSTNQILSLSLDRTVRFWDPRQEEATACYKLEHQVYCSDMLYPYLGMALSQQKILMLNLEDIESSIGTEEARKENYIDSRLDSMTEITCMRLFSEGEGEGSLGFCVGGIDGRCNLAKVGEGQRKDQNIITFKTRTQEQGLGVFSVNCVGFHPNFGKGFLFTGRGDGRMNFWDVNHKSKIVEFDFGGKVVTQAEIDPAGKFLAYSLAGDWDEDGVEKGARICVHVLQERELKYQAVEGVTYAIKYP